MSNCYASRGHATINTLWYLKDFGSQLIDLLEITDKIDLHPNRRWFRFENMEG